MYIINAPELKKLDKINEACGILNALRDNTILLESSLIHQLPNTICIVYTAVLDKVLWLLGEVIAEMEKEMEEAAPEDDTIFLSIRYPSGAYLKPFLLTQGRFFMFLLQ